MSSAQNHQISILKFSILILMMGMLFSCKENEIERVRALSEKEGVPVQSSFDVEMSFSDSGREKVKLFSDRMDRYIGKKKRVEFPRGLHVIFFADSGGVNSELTADKGVMYEEKRRMIVRNNVEFTNQKGEKLNTEKLVWSQDSGKVFTDKFVKITRNEGVIHGNGLIAEEDFSKYKVKEITGQLYFDRSKIEEGDEKGE